MKILENLLKILGYPLRKSMKIIENLLKILGYPLRKSMKISALYSPRLALYPPRPALYLAPGVP